MATLSKPAPSEYSATVGMLSSMVVGLSLDIPARPGGLDVDKLYTFLYNVFIICGDLSVDPLDIVAKKMAINRAKYPAAACKELQHVPKWTELSGVGAVSQSIIPVYCQDDEYTGERFARGFSAVASEVHSFAAARGWLGQYTETRICLALVAEVGELAEVLQWLDPDMKVSNFSPDILSRCCSEIADILVYAVHACRLLGVNQDHLEDLFEVW